MATLPTGMNYYSPRVPDFFEEAVDYSRLMANRNRPFHGASSNMSGGISDKHSESSESKKFSPFIGNKNNPFKP